MSELLNIGLFSFGLWMCFLNRNESPRESRRPFGLSQAVTARSV